MIEFEIQGFAEYADNISTIGSPHKTAKVAKEYHGPIVVYQ
tara:strand:+ start:346 stop:468 length:123 start_codon:yes stop_codon:yes gene_type:complete